MALKRRYLQCSLDSYSLPRATDAQISDAAWMQATHRAANTADCYTDLQYHDKACAQLNLCPNCLRENKNDLTGSGTGDDRYCPAICECSDCKPSPDYTAFINDRVDVFAYVK